MGEMFLLKPGFVEDSVIYKIELVEVARLSEATLDDIENKLDELGVRQLVLDAGHPQIIERLRRKWFIHKLLRKKSAHSPLKALKS